jgi:hypothetical protein
VERREEKREEKRREEKRREEKRREEKRREEKRREEKRRGAEERRGEEKIGEEKRGDEKEEKRRRGVGNCERDDVLERKKLPALKVPMQCPLFLLLKVVPMGGKVSGGEALG